MNNELLTYFYNDIEVKKLDSYLPFSANSLESLALSVATSFKKNKRDIALVFSSLFEAQTFLDFISNFISKDDILFYPYDEVLRLEAVSSSKEMLKERIYSSYKALTSKNHIFITHSVAIIHEVSPKEAFLKSIKRYKVHSVIDRKELVNNLISLGYVKVNKVENVFEFSLRGEILDIFSPSSYSPYRIEFFDDEIDEIRLFDVASELSFKEVDSFEILPCHDLILSKEEVDRGIEKIKEEVASSTYKSKLEKDEINNKISKVVFEVINNGIDETSSRYIPYFKEGHDSILSYLSSFEIYLYKPQEVISLCDSYLLDMKEYLLELYKDNLALKNESSAFSFEDIKFNYLSIDDEFASNSIIDIPYSFKNVNNALKAIEDLKEDGYKVKTYLSKEKYEKFKDILLGEENDDVFVEIIDKDLSRGFLIKDKNLVILSSKEIFGINRGSEYFLKRFKEAKVIAKYQDLAIGDYVVNEEHGIGRYVGIDNIDGLDYLKIQYALEGQFLYVPLAKYKLIRKYSSREGLTPKLDTLGGTSWARRKAKIRGRVTYLADKLIEINAIRKAKPGFAFQKDDEFEESFAKAFPYELTLAQKKALEDIKEDMMAPHPMDRLLAGDVGFGKTEVAFRAAFKAILSHKQVALLCPTTVLAKQHYEVAKERFEGFDVNIALLSRHISQKDQNQILEDLSLGKIHFLIGTHRILSQDVKFLDLGLLIVDEEQRFGVTHKEKIKELATNIDVLTLSATPIPRTLQMSLLNVKPMSILKDPPINRLPIKTYVVKYDKNLIKEVISRELGRKGQVYYLHNRINSITATAKELETMFPNARVGIVHGQMDVEDINDVMEEFYDGKIDILVCTSIIETGLDVANCNTLIVENAQNFGLSQLYQIKGRVGRSSRLAYAYLTYGDKLALNDDARKRLKALKDFTELGSGYKIASQDLNIRGAGDILGKEQAGFIDSIGYDAYMSLINDVMKEKDVMSKAKKETQTRFELSFSLDSAIPSTYASENDRISIYKEYFDIVNKEELEVFRNKINDVYGHFPEEVENLFTKKEVEIMLSSSYVNDFKETLDRYIIKMNKDYSRIPHIGLLVKESMEKIEEKVYWHFGNGTFTFTLVKTSDYLIDLYDLMTTLLSFAKA